MKTTRRQEPFIPQERSDTIRHEITALLMSGTVSAREISQAVHISEKEIAGHLEHIRKSLHGGELKLSVTPAECIACGFVFTKRERLTKPGSCPVCKGSHIEEPLYAIQETGARGT